MTKDYRRLTEEATQGVLLDDPAFLREIVERKLQEFLEAEMTELVGCGAYVLTTERAESHPPGARAVLRSAWADAR
jgi:transposase-like protein